MKKESYLYVGIAVTCFSLAGIQMFLPEMLPIGIYSYVALTSFQLTFIEFIKMIAQYALAFRHHTIYATEQNLQLCKKEIDVLSKHSLFSESLAANRALYTKMESELEKYRDQERTDKWMIRMVRILTVIQVGFCFALLAIYLAIGIPDNLASNKMIGILSLLSFGFLFVSYYWRSSSDDQLTEGKMLISGKKQLSEYYLTLLERVITEKEESKSNKSS